MDRNGDTRIFRAAATCVGIVLVAVFAAGAYVEWQWRASFGGAPFAQRLASARRAARVEPWVARYASRPDRVLAEEYAARHQPANAYAALRRAIDIDPGDERLRAQLKAAYKAYYEATTYKAHVQHAREQSGGVLREQDVVK